ncbi:MAG: N-acetylmuramoyl-L-alanine amidase [Bacteroidota bacterium]
MTTHKLEGPWRTKPMTDGPNGIIIHAMGEYVNHQYAPDFMKSVGGSVHAFISVEGKVLLGADWDTGAFHAGKSAFEGSEDLNASFLGVEVLVEGQHNMASFRRAVEEHHPYKEQQYIALAELCALWISKFGIDRRLVLAHAHVSGQDVRRDPKIDPGATFNWEKLHLGIDHFLSHPPITMTENETK